MRIYKEEWARGKSKGAELEHYCYSILRFLCIRLNYNFATFFLHLTPCNLIHMCIRVRTIKSNKFTLIIIEKSVFNVCWKKDSKEKNSSSIYLNPFKLTQFHFN